MRAASAYRYLALFLLLWASYGYFLQPLGPNELSRYDLVRALVDDRTVSIDRYQENTIDKGYVAGHYYSDKAFGLSLLAIPAYVAVRTVDRYRGADFRNAHGTIFFLILLAVALPAALLGVLLARFAALLASESAALLTALAFGLGTIAFPFSTMFFGHQTASSFAFAAAYMLAARRLRDPTGNVGTVRALGAGLLAGCAALVEYPVAIIGVLLFVYLLAFCRRRHAIAFLVGTAPAALVLAVYNYVAYGNPLSVSYAYVTNPAFSGAHRGLLGVSLPDPATAFQLLFSGKGLLFNSPLLIMAPIGVWWLWQARRARPEAGLCVAVTLAFLIYNAGYYLPFGGMTAGPRFLIPALPFLALTLAPVFDLPMPWRALSRVLAVCGIAVATLATFNGPLVSESEYLPIFKVWLPGVWRGEVVYNLGQWLLRLPGPASLLPLLAFGCLCLLFLARMRPRPLGRALNDVGEHFRVTPGGH